MGWSIELVSIDILTEVSFLFRHLCYPREVHLDAVYHIFRCLHKNLGKNPGIVTYYPMYEPTDEDVFDVVVIYLYEWKDIYPDSW